MNVYEYFEARLGNPSTDETLKELLCMSYTGIACIRAIDKAADLIAVCDAGNGYEIHNQIIAAVDHSIQIFWRG